MRINAHVASGATKTLPFPVRNVLLGLGIAILLGHSEVHNMNDYRVVNSDINNWRHGHTVGVLRSRTTNEKVIGLDITINQVLLVDRLYSGDLGIELEMNVFKPADNVSSPSVSQPCTQSLLKTCVRTCRTNLLSWVLGGP